MRIAFLAILRLSHAISTIVAALAHIPIMVPVTVAAFIFSAVYMALAANTSPPALLMATLIVFLFPSPFSSSIKLRYVTQSSSHQLSSLSIVPKSCNSAESPLSMKFQNLLFLGFAAILAGGVAVTLGSLCICFFLAFFQIFFSSIRTAGRCLPG